MASLVTSFIALFLLGTATAAGVPPSVSLTDLLNSPVTYLGHEIAVSGRVHDVYNSYVFNVPRRSRALRARRLHGIPCGTRPRSAD